ncbi:MAG: hypothetical protein SNJ82_07875 [Gemmataceae bacterium]
MNTHRTVDKRPHPPRKPVVGQVYPGSAFKASALILVSSLVEAAGIGLVVAYFAAEWPFWTLIVGAVVAVGGLAGTLAALFQRVPLRLILAADRLQQVEGQGESESVVLELPYRNLAEVVYQGGEDERIGLDLIHTGDPDTYQADGQLGLEASKRSKGHHVVLTSQYKQPLRMIYDELKRRIRAAQEVAPKEG